MNQNTSPVFHRHLHRQPPIATGGHGVYITDSSGKDYIDACGGAAVSCLGHGHPDVSAAMHAQIDKLAYAHTGSFSSIAAEELAEQLIRTTPTSADFSHVYYTSGGSEAVEAALKMARQYFIEIGQPQRTKFIARRQSYHGNTLGALAVSGNKSRRMLFEPLLIDVTHVSPCYPYRDKRINESDIDYGLRLAAELDDTILREGSETIIAFIAETVGGATAGVIGPVPGYLKAIREVCDRHGVLLILDEVMCGMGRTGTMHAWESEAAYPDLQTIAKGLGGGYQPIGAVLASRKIVGAIGKGSGFFHHGHTYLGHPVACAAALAVQRVIQRDNLLAQVKDKGKILNERLLARFGNHPNVGDIRGRGLFWGIELVTDRDTKAAFEPAFKLNATIKAEAMARGLLVYPGGGCIDGLRGDHVMLAPPYITSSAELELIVERLGEAIDAALKLH